MEFSKFKDGLSSAVERLRPIARGARVLWFPLLFCYLELILHYYGYGSFNQNTLWVILFSLGLGAFFSFVTCVFPGKVNAVLTYVFTFVFTLIFEVQLVYFEIFKGFAPVSALKMGGQAITNFTGGLMEGIRQALPFMILLLVPFAVLVIFGIWLRPGFSRADRLGWAIPLLVSFALFCGTIGTMAMFFNGTPSLYKNFSSSKTSTDTSVNCFGMNMTVVQEFRWMLFPEDNRITAESLNNRDHPEGAQVDELVDFEALYEKAGDDEALKNLTAELSNMATTSKNKYTGLCEGYNLVAICAEAFSPEFIDPELTPTLYKLTTNGFVFNNYYATFPNTTTNGEYAFCMGLYPDLSRTKTDSSFSVSTTNYLPYCYGNLFKANGGIAKGYHNYVAEFYYRNFTHANMGYDFVAANNGLDIEITWPSSDLDMMVASVDDYIHSGEQFVAYYMTFSGHYQYTLENAMSAKNWDKVKDLPYSDAVKAYIACNLELEYALQHLMDSLEDAGVADKTMIVLTTDHYPYGLTDAEYAELSGREINDIFDKQKNSFICYVPGMDPVQVDAYCSTTDILPTVLNLMGFTYDSRLLAGHDVLAPDATHVAIMADGSFIADGVSYDASLMQYHYEEDTAEARQLGEELYELLEKRLHISTEILNNDYYSFVYDRQSGAEEIDDITKQYKDVGIMEQSVVYYILKHDIMDPTSETSFGLYENFTLIETLDAIYRIAGRPEIDPDEINAPFTVPEGYEKAVAWTYANGILMDDGLIVDALKEKIKVGQLALFMERTAKYYGMDTSVDEEAVASAMERYKHLDERVIRASVFCRDENLIRGDGKENYVFYTSTIAVDKSFVASTLYKLCSYYILPEDE